MGPSSLFMNRADLSRSSFYSMPDGNRISDYGPTARYAEITGIRLRLPHPYESYYDFFGAKYIGSSQLSSEVSSVVLKTGQDMGYMAIIPSV